MDNRTERLASGVWRIEVAALTNAYLIARDGVGADAGLLLVDTGTRASGPRLVRSIRLLGLDPRGIDTVVLTHWHADHAGSAARFSASSAAPRVRARSPDAAVAAGEQPGGDGQRTRLGRLVQPRVRRPPAVEVGALANEAELLGGARVVPAPGHTEGSCALWLPASGVLLAGDAVYNILRPTIGPRALCEDLDAVPSTLSALAGLDPAAVAPGHGPPLRRAPATTLLRLAEREQHQAARIRTRAGRREGRP